jgi:polygalacturonase
MTTLIPKYDQSSTGAVNRPSNLKLSEIISLGDFIPVGTNTSSTDCTSYIQAAINAFSNNALYIPAGAYYFTGVLTISNPLTNPS